MLGCYIEDRNTERIDRRYGGVHNAYCRALDPDTIKWYTHTKNGYNLDQIVVDRLDKALYGVDHRMNGGINSNFNMNEGKHMPRFDEKHVNGANRGRSLKSTPKSLPKHPGFRNRRIHKEHNEDEYETVEEILDESSGENSVGLSNETLSSNVLDQRSPRRQRKSIEKPIIQKTSALRDWTHFFRILDLIRAICTSSYGIFLVVNYWNDPQYIELGATPFFYASLMAFVVDFLSSAVKAFPQWLWFFWDVKTFDPFVRSISIWNLVADHNLIVDMLPLMANVILKVYWFRLGEVVMGVDGYQQEYDPFFALFGFYFQQQDMNLLFLAVFAGALVSCIFLHSFRICFTLISDKRAFALSFIIIIKVLLMIFDIFVNAVLLYETLVFKGKELFKPSFLVNLVLAVLAFSPAIGLTTNVVLNILLHILHIKMQLRERKELLSEKNQKKVEFSRILKAATRKTFHPFIWCVFGTYGLFSTISLVYILHVIYEVDYLSFISIDPTLTPGSDWNIRDAQSRKEALILLVWVNLILNYLLAVSIGILYWIWQVIITLKYLFRCCCAF